MAITLASWNTDPNIEWYVRCYDDGGTPTVELYHSYADAQSETNRDAAGIANGDNEVLLIGDDDATYTVEKYDPNLSFHLTVSGTGGDNIYRVGPFMDIGEYEHAMYKNADIALQKAQQVINIHTHVEYEYGFNYKGILDLELNQVANVQDSRLLDTNFDGRIDGFTFQLGRDSETLDMSLKKYEVWEKE